MPLSLATHVSREVQRQKKNLKTSKLTILLSTKHKDNYDEEDWVIPFVNAYMSYEQHVYHVVRYVCVDCNSILVKLKLTKDPLHIPLHMMVAMEEVKPAWSQILRCLNRGLRVCKVM